MIFNDYRAWLKDKKQNTQQMIYMKDFDSPLDFWAKYYSFEGSIKVLMPKIYVHDRELYERDIIKSDKQLYVVRYSVSVGAFVAELARDPFYIFLLPDIIQKAEIVGNLYEDYEKIKVMLNEWKRKK